MAKRKRIATKKLLVDQRVEVRSMEDGLLGSWHAGIVIGCGEQSRHIRYEELLNDDGSLGMVEVVKVSPVLDGLLPEDCSIATNFRGNIRPSPPLIDFQKRSLHYGQCVDVRVHDAWWEGVIFDHEDGSNERRVFFPDLGDELKAQMDILRLTQEWDEVTEEWKPRGNWALLELLEKIELNWPLLVSVRQIWYEIQMKFGSEKLEWTYSCRDVWKELLGQVLCSGYNLTMKQIVQEICSSGGDFVEENKRLLEYSGPGFDFIIKPEELFCDYKGIVPFGTNSQSNPEPPVDLISTNSLSPEKENAPLHLVSTESDGYLDRDSLTHLMPSSDDLRLVSTPLTLLSFPSQDDNIEVGSSTNSKRYHFISPGKKLKWKTGSSDGRTRLLWHSAESDMHLEAERCLDSVSQYISSRRGCQNVRKHLIWLGWKVQYSRDGRITRMRYISPKNEVYYSLYKVCLVLQSGDPSPSSQDNERNNDVMASSLVRFQLTQKPQKQIDRCKMFCQEDIVHVEKEFCPQAVLEYSQLRSGMRRYRINSDGNTGSIASKAKKHLSAVGWTFYHYRRGKKEKLYESPEGKRFYSLITACHWCVKEGECSLPNAHSKQVRGESVLRLTCTNSSSSSACMESAVVTGDLSQKLSIESSLDKSFPSQLVQKGKINVQGRRTLPRRKRRGLLNHSTASQNDGSMLLDSSDSTKKRDDAKAEFLQTIKRARQGVVSSSTCQSPRTVLSLLIDGNIVLPRTKVHYRNKKDGLPMKEGTISREGIKCNCCQEVFPLSRFEAHAGSSLHRPSANIFLEDGRSIFECQLQLKRENKVKNSRSEPRRGKGNRRQQPASDHICTICHYGGELLLCDHCPSSFHTRCVGLKDIPDGDWFCPSCCCAICGLGRFKGDKEDDNSLNCGQCEHRYHIGCLRSKDLVKPDYQPEGNWFCNSRCEQIHSGLQNLLGKPIPVGHDDLAWTLLKYKGGAEVSDQDARDSEYLMERYSKLNVALSIMHECFEPMKEPRTRRDLVEDVVFSRWSELHRLNFQGFYTIALERDDELITVATIRIYGEKVAEIPLVATRFQYRRLGMCRILVNELEKKLMELGVERLVLPAIPSMLKTWETSFGFSTMKDAERFDFLNCTFLDFQGTVLCQKLLKESIPFSSFSQSSEVEERVCNDNGENEINLAGNNAVQEVVIQGDQPEESEIVDQGTADVLQGIGSKVGNVCSPPITTMVNQSPELLRSLVEQGNHQVSEQVKQTTPLIGNVMTQQLLAETSDKELGDSRTNVFKFYKRRRLATCES